MKNEDIVSNDRSLASGARGRAQCSALGTGAMGLSSLISKPAFRLVAKTRLADGNSDFNATPAIAGRQLFLRSNRTLYCIASVQTADAGKTQ